MVQRTRCHNCGHSNPKDRRFCARCGVRLGGQPADIPQTSEAIPPPRLEADGFDSPPPRRPAPNLALILIAGVMLLLVTGGIGFAMWQMQAPVVATNPQPVATPPAPTQAAQPAPGNQGGQPAPAPTGDVRATIEAQTATAIIADSRAAQATTAAEQTTLTPPEPTATVPEPTRTPYPTATAITPFGAGTTTAAPLPVNGLPLYPGAVPADPGDPFVQGVQQQIDSQQVPYLPEIEQTEFRVFTLPPDVTYSDITAFYVDALTAAGWQAPTADTLATPVAGANPPITLLRGNQRLVVQYVSGEQVGNVGGRGYLTLILVTGNY
jgi:hypothetical protein